jgi:cellulose biosynthesis protein BcsQ
MRASASSQSEPGPTLGRIITFYSYKGGTGRSMALANVAWILACNGLRVLVIDWDLEAPGLHRYFCPFLPDPELSETPGLIDFFVHFIEAAHVQASSKEASPKPERPWFYDRADLLRYSVPLTYEFPNGGMLDFVGAGQQGSSYSIRVNSFQWGDFYEKFGGGIFLEAMKVQMREHYDYVLIDSRTGLSDTSGICTVQMPDELVICFTLNRQSIFGAASMAKSADAQRRLKTGEQGLRIWPVPTRVELHEKTRLDSARLVARQQFAPFLWHIPVSRRTEFWGETEVLYFPYYAYEEVLASIADPPWQKVSLLNSMERLTARLTGDKVRAMPSLPSGQRESLLALYQPPNPSQREKGRKFFLSFARADKSERTVTKIAEAIDRQFGARSAFWFDSIPLGANVRESLESGIKEADALIVVIGPNWRKAKGSFAEVNSAIDLGKTVVPVLLPGVTTGEVPTFLKTRRLVRLGKETLDDDLNRFVGQLGETVSFTPTAPVDIDDPQKGKFGGVSERNGRRIVASVSPLKSQWFTINLKLEPTGDVPLTGSVEFHLHPTFRPEMISVPTKDGVASLKLRAWGPFTVGAVADKGQTRLELDLAHLSGVPRAFRER